MTHISRKKLPLKTEKEIISALKSVFLNLKPKEVDKIFSSLITPTEETMLAKRLAATLLLYENASYEEITNTLNLTDQTIAKINFEMNQYPKDYKFLISRLKPWKKKQILKAIFKDLGLKGLKIFAKHAGGRIY